MYCSLKNVIFCACVCLCVSEAKIRGPMYHKVFFHFHMPVPNVSKLPMTLTCCDELSD